MLRLMLKILSYGVIVIILGCLGIYFYNTHVIESETLLAAESEGTELLIADDSTLAYRVWPGSGTKKVVLVGGLGAWAGTWEATIDEQRKRGSDATFIVVDLPPFGYSTAAPNVPYSRAVQSERIAAFLATQSHPLTLAAHSYGGGVAAETALQHPELIDHLILIDPALGLNAEPATPLPWFLDYPAIPQFVIGLVLQSQMLVKHQLQGFVAIIDNIDEALVEQYRIPFRREGTSHRLALWIHDYLTDQLHIYVSTKVDSYKELPMQVDLIWGEADMLTPINDAYQLTDVSSDLKLHTLPGVGHIPMIEDIELFNDVFYTITNPS